MRKFLCWLGLHDKKDLILKAVATTSNGRNMDLHYSVCVHCEAGDPRVAGEY